jgi:hypothetical protein
MLSVLQQQQPAPPQVSTVFSTTLYTSSGGARTVTNGINLATHGGMVWERPRNRSEYHSFIDSARGVTEYLLPTSVSGAGTDTNYMSSFNSDGYSLLTSHLNGDSLLSYTFRQASRFFKIATYTGTGTVATQAVPINLGAQPGLIIVKTRSASGDWLVWHRSLSPGYTLKLQSIEAETTTPAGVFASVSDSVVTVSSSANIVGATYVMYAFAHDPTGIIECGSFACNGSGYGTVGLGSGWDVSAFPSLVLLKRIDSNAALSNWYLADPQRQYNAGYSKTVNANTLDGEVDTYWLTSHSVVASSIVVNDGALAGAEFVYMAIKGA